MPQGSVIYVARVDKKNKPQLSRPCSKCMKTIADAGIREVWYTNELGGLSHEIIM